MNAGTNRMDIIFRIVAAVLTITTTELALAEVINLHADEEIGTVRQVYDGKLDPDLQVNTFRNIDRLFPTAVVRRGSQVAQLPLKDEPFRDFSFESKDVKYDLYDYVDSWLFTTEKLRTKTT